MAVNLPSVTSDIAVTNVAIETKFAVSCCCCYCCCVLFLLLYVLMAVLRFMVMITICLVAIATFNIKIRNLKLAIDLQGQMPG